jgi:DNA-directed RNA polymerase omega subunit
MYKLPQNLTLTKYQFVTLASKRAEQLQMGALPRVDGGAMRKLTVVAQEEVARGFVQIWTPETEEAIQEETEEE